MKKLALMLCIFVLALTACGKKGSPKPPETLAPDRVMYFTAEGEVDRVRLTWEAPEKNASGKTLTDLAGFVVQKRNIIPDETEDFETVAEIPHSYDEPLEKYVFEDMKVEPGKRYDYVVLPINDDDVKGERAGILRVTFVGESSVVERF